MGENRSLQFGSMPDADKKFVVDALNKGANRRQVMGWLMAMGATITTAGSIVTSAQEAIAATPKRGGKIRFAWNLHGPNDTLDPIGYLSSLDYGRGRMMYNNLCRLNEDLSVGPELAESFEANSTATEWTFTLRKDVEWHDGSKLTADDVIYSMNRHMGDKSTSNARILVSGVSEWKRVDDYTVEAIMSSGDAELPVVLGTFHFKIVKNGTTDFQKPVGTGPFVLTQFKPGIRAVHVRNDNYWGSGGPYLDEIESFAITDEIARVNALLSGDVDVVGAVDPKAIAQVEGTEGKEMFIVNSGAYMSVASRYNNSYAGADNLDFVTGLKYLQRRDRILKVVQKGIGDIGNDQPVGPAYGSAYCDDQKILPYDPDKAKFHLKKAGITAAELKVAELAPGLTDICLMLQRECSKVGFDLQIKKVPNDGYWGVIWNQDPFHVASWNMRPSANIMMKLAYATTAPWNESAWSNERFDKLVVEAVGQLDIAKRDEIHCELQDLVAKDAGTIIATHRAYLDAKSTKLKGFPKIPTAALGGMEWPEYVWLDT